MFFRRMIQHDFGGNVNIICVILTNYFWQKFRNGLDIVDLVLRDAEVILSSDVEAVSQRSAVRLWSFLSKFVMLDCFEKALGVADVIGGGGCLSRSFCAKKDLRKRLFWHCSRGKQFSLNA
jgi:hypothetical protein